MATDTRLNFLVKLREDVRLTQADVARRFGLSERQGYKSVAAWEQGESVPAARRRSRFIGYLWDDLSLRKDPARFEACWETLVERWHWEPLSDEERSELHLPPLGATGRAVPDIPLSSTTNAEGSVVGGDVTATIFAGRDQHNYIFLFSEFYQQTNASVDAVKLAAALTEYLEWLADSTHTIELRGIPARGNVVSLPLDEIFVPLRAEIADQRRRNEDRTIALDQLLTVGEQLAVIGGPGSGKSTVLQYIAWVLATALLENDAAWATQRLGLRLVGDDALPPLPIYLPLSAYARLHFHGGDAGAATTFPDFIQHYLQQSHCNITGLPADFFSNLLQSGRRVILLLDGLDEVANEREREIVTQTIENLVAGRKQKLRVVVTCRSVAYKGQAILTRGFRQVTVQPLDSEHVERLVQQAYAAVYATNLVERDAHVAELLAGIARLEGEHARRLNEAERTLVNSPLLVRMLLVVHLNDRKLPQHRADLYRRFVDTILNSEHVADRAVANELSALRGNNLALMSHLAFAMHSQGQTQGREVELDTLRALLQPDFADETAAFEALIHLRGTLVEERDGYYRFIHLAFQEYLAARHLAEVYWRDEGIKGTMRFLAAQTPDSWWREVATLLPGYLREALPPHAKRVIYALSGGHDGTTNWQSEAANWSPDVQLAAAEIAATATLEWFDRDEDMRRQLALRLMRIFTNPDLLNETRLQLRILAARALNELGDLRFRADAWYLPNDPMLGFIEMPAGTFTMGEGEEAHRVTLPTFYIARWPVTVAQFRAFVEATAEQPVRTKIRSDSDNHPVARRISWFNATQYCAWLTETLRTWQGTPAPVAAKLQRGWQIMLPSEAEWERAARGSEGRIYPWGNEDAEPNRANYKATGIGTTSVVGCFLAGATPEGVEELSGNVYEWTRSLYQAYPYPSDEQGRSERERFQAEDEDRFVIRGGSYEDFDQNIRAPARDNERADLDFFDDYGFRVVVSSPALGV